MKRWMLGLVGSAMLCWSGTALAADPVRIGAAYAMSGPASFLGVPEERALRMRVDALNKTGGLNGHPIELTVYDTEGNGTKAVQQIRRLIESNNVHVVLGPSSSGESLLAIPIANEAKTPIITHAGAERVVVPPTPYVFMTPPTDRIVAAHLLGVFKKRGIKSVAVLSAADGFGQSGANVVKELAPGYGVKVAAHEEFNRQDADMTTQVLRARESGADALLIWSAFPAPTVIVRNARAMGYTKPIFNSFAAASRDIIVQAGAVAEGTYVSSMRLLAPDSLPEADPLRPIVRRIYDEFRARYNEAPAVFAAHSYDAMLILEQAAKRIQGPITREALRDAIEKVDVIGGNGHFRFTPANHNGLDASSNSMVLLVVKDGQWVVAE